MKKTKLALIASAIALLLCISMLCGTTYAWFTDSVTSANNIIKSGSLDVSLLHKGSADINYSDVSSTTGLFKSKIGSPMLWEPGLRSTELFRVENKGSLALTYKLTVNFTDPTYTADNHSLLDVLKVEITLPDGTTVVKPVGSFSYSGSIKAGEGPHDFTVSIFWEHSGIDDLLNVDGGMKVNLGVNLYATQDTVEEDSFDNTYDAPAADLNNPSAP